jgi:putative ABC transport system substrate-binding protein
MKRREFITLLSGAGLAWPLAARAQRPDRMRRIGWLTAIAADDPEGQARLTAFVQGLQQLGWTVGQNVRIDYRWGGSNADDIRKYAAELVALAPDVILAQSSAAVAPLLLATRTIPVVFTTVADPVGAGFVETLARPGGNATGFTNFEYSIAGKWLELLKEIAPGVMRVAVLRESAISAGAGQFGAIQAQAQSLGVELRPLDVRDAGEIERAITAFARGSNGGLIVTGSPAAVVHRGADRCAGGTAPITRRLQHPLLRHRRRSDLLWPRFRRPVPPRRRLRRSHPQGRETGGPGGAAADQIRAGDKSQDRQGARPRRAADGASTRRRGYRMSGYCTSG